MIVEVFLVFIGIALVCMIIGEMTKELSWTAVGCIIFFILITWVVFGKYTAPSVIGADAKGLEFRSGEIESYSYVCSSCLDSRFSNSTGNTTTVGSKTTTYIYSSYDDGTTFWIGFFLSMIASLSILLLFVDRKKISGGK